jgi:excinuclease ABC subunit A
MPLSELYELVSGLELPGEASVVAADILAELRARLGFLCEVGLEYLTLERLTRTLSGGEAQRINLANSMGCELGGRALRSRRADRRHAPARHRPAGGDAAAAARSRQFGGSGRARSRCRRGRRLADRSGAGRRRRRRRDRLCRSGAGGDHADRPAAACSADASRTLAYRNGAAEVPCPPTHRAPGSRWLELANVRRHNLRGIDARFPLGVFCCVTGVSGSGKSTLVGEVLYEALERRMPPDRGALGSYDEIRGAHLVHGVVLVDQSPIGRTPRSNPLSYMKGLADVRALFASTAAARMAKVDASAFSFNTPGGRCEACEGMGWVQIEMHFMADVFVRCDHCEGQRFGPQVLGVRYRGRNIADVLEMTVEEALAFFHDSPGLGEKLYGLKRVGLGYLRLGQPAPTLSGGESQRLKIARALTQKSEGNLLYLLDEPTTGLHLDDIARLLRVLHELVERGHSVIVVEHQLDVVRAADWVIDLGPEAGSGGGTIVYAGPPEACSRNRVRGLVAVWRSARRAPRRSSSSRRRGGRRAALRDRRRRLCGQRGDRAPLARRPHGDGFRRPVDRPPRRRARRGDVRAGRLA